MHNRDFVIAPQSAFTDLGDIDAGDRAVGVQDFDGVGLANVQVHNGREQQLAERINARFNVALPRGPRYTNGGRLALAGIGPGSWLAIAPERANELPRLLESEISGLASVSDQSDGLAVLRLTGAPIRKVLTQFVAVDIHARAFAVGDVAVTTVAYVGVTFWRLSDSREGFPVFEFAVPRSFASSFTRLLMKAIRGKA